MPAVARPLSNGRLAQSLDIILAPEALYILSDKTRARVVYGSGQITRCLVDDLPGTCTTRVSVCGLLGIVKLFTKDVLICITKTVPVATFPSHPEPAIIHRIIETLAIPLTSYADADQAVSQLTGGNELAKSQQDSLYGLGAFLWRRQSRPSITKIPLSEDDISKQALDARILTEALNEMRSGLYFAYNLDATHNLQVKFKAYDNARAASLKQQSPKGKRAVLVDQNLFTEPDGDKPICERVDTRFWWNRHICKPFLASSLQDLVYPCFQGFVAEEKLPFAAGQNAESLRMTIISRRSIERPGLRYQRRGINQQGGTANFVETEFLIMQSGLAEADESDDTTATNFTSVSSFVQTRGSIPLFWSQSPWALKPIPVLERALAENHEAFKRHFDCLHKHYGPITVINLAEQHGKEGVVVEAFRSLTEEDNDELLRYVAWDFHQKCKGMKYERIVDLMDQLAPIMKDQKLFVASQQQVTSIQNGVFRVNCMDCLDRTNVIQSAIARHVLDTALARLELLPLDAKDRKGIDSAFNELWASNGDAISRQYAGTSALKGDFTRTGQRNFRGVINDASNSLARLYQNTVGDFFKQTMIDYILGENVRSFTDFQDKLASHDPNNLHRLEAIRTSAIETCASQLLSSESRVAELTLLAPMSHAEHANHLPDEYEEKVILLTNKALYIVSYEYTLDKIRDFVKLPLMCIERVTHGAFVLSSLSPFARDPLDNYGFLLEFRLLDGEGQRNADYRANTYSLRTRPTRRSEDAQQLEQNKLVFKAIRANLSRDDQVATVAATGRTTVLSFLKTLDDTRQSLGADHLDVVEKDIRSVKDAILTESVFGRLLHSIEQYIWL